MDRWTAPRTRWAAAARRPGRFFQSPRGLPLAVQARSRVPLEAAGGVCPCAHGSTHLVCGALPGKVLHPVSFLLHGQERTMTSLPAEGSRRSCSSGERLLWQLEENGARHCRHLESGTDCSSMEAEGAVPGHCSRPQASLLGLLALVTHLLLVETEHTVQSPGNTTLICQASCVRLLLTSEMRFLISAD